MRRKEGWGRDDNEGGKMKEEAREK